MIQPGTPGVSGLAERTTADTDGDVRRILEKLESTGQLLTVSRLVANSPALFRAFVLFSDGILTRSRLPGDLRELCILRLAALKDAEYEWAEHVGFSSRAGVTDEQRHALAEGRLPEGVDDDRLAALAAVEKLAEGGGWSAEDWDDLRARFGPDGAIDLVMIAGWYGGVVPVLTKALGLEPDNATYSQKGRAT